MKSRRVAAVGPSPCWDGYFIVHGHTPNDARRKIRRFRSKLDGGAAMTGVAKMAILRGADVEA